MTDTTENKSSLSEAEKFLESLNLPDSQAQETDGNVTGGSTDPNDIMSFLDEISNYPTEDAAAASANEKKEAGKSHASQPAPAAIAANSSGTKAEVNKEQTSTPTTTEPPSTQQQQQQDSGSWTSWGNSFWSQASAAVKTTTDQINRSVGSENASKLLESRVKTLQSLVNKENIEKLGRCASRRNISDLPTKYCLHMKKKKRYWT
jgi:hypothetical protein